MLRQQPLGAPSTVEQVQWNYIQTLEQKVAYLEHELGQAHAQLMHQHHRESDSSCSLKESSKTPDPEQFVERSPRPGSEEDATPESSNSSMKRRKYVRKPRVSDSTLPSSWIAGRLTLDSPTGRLPQSRSRHTPLLPTVSIPIRVADRRSFFVQTCESNIKIAICLFPIWPN